MILIARDDPTRADVRQLLHEHLADMLATSPADSMHALDQAGLSAPEIAFWTAREDGLVLGCGALKRLGAGQGEIMHLSLTDRTSPAMPAAHTLEKGIRCLHPN